MLPSIFQNQCYGLLAGSLALWRVAHLLAEEEGPFEAASRLRHWAGDGFLGRALDCFYCLSLWLALPVAALIGGDWAQRLMLWPALSGAACLLERATKHSEFPGVIYEEPTESKHVL